MFIDETGTSTNMARTRGRAKRGCRVVGRVPHGHWKITTFVAGLRCDGVSAPFVIDRPMNSAIFLAYVTQSLVPTLKPADSDGSRPAFRDDLARHSDLMSLGIPG